MWKLPANGQVYAAWLGKTGDRRPLGQFKIGNDGKATVSYTVPRGRLAGYRWLWVTSETGRQRRAAEPEEDRALGPLT